MDSVPGRLRSHDFADGGGLRNRALDFLQLEGLGFRARGSGFRV